MEVRKIFYIQVIGTILIVAYIILLAYRSVHSFPLFMEKELSDTIYLGDIIRTTLFGLAFTVYCRVMIKKEITLNLIEGQMEELERWQAKQRQNDNKI